jgi:hypothetical protein
MLDSARNPTTDRSHGFRQESAIASELRAVRPPPHHRVESTAARSRVASAGRRGVNRGSLDRHASGILLRPRRAGPADFRPGREAPAVGSRARRHPGCSSTVAATGQRLRRRRIPRLTLTGGRSARPTVDPASNDASTHLGPDRVRAPKRRAARSPPIRARRVAANALPESLTSHLHRYDLEAGAPGPQRR